MICDACGYKWISKRPGEACPGCGKNMRDMYGDFVLLDNVLEHLGIS